MAEQMEASNTGRKPGFLRAFVPGLVLGLVLGLFVGAVAAPLMDRGSAILRDPARRTGGGLKPAAVHHEAEVLPDGSKAGEAPVRANDAENKKTDLPDQPAPPSNPPAAPAANPPSGG